MPVVNHSEWIHWLSGMPEVHLLQTAAWGELKQDFGWKAARIVSEKNRGAVGAQILFRHLALGYKFAYIPRGPVFQGEGGWQANTAFREEIDRLCRRNRVVFLKVEPDAWENEKSVMPPSGFIPSDQNIQPLRTLVVNLVGSEDDLLARMKQKTRYNVRLAIKKGVEVSCSDDLTAFYNLMIQTGARDSFGIHSLEYYQKAYELFHPTGNCELFLARYAGVTLAGLMAFSHGERGWYFYGASGEEYRELMPAYLLQWEAMRWARKRGCTSYDLYGVPDVDETTLESNFTTRSDGLWGVYRFKRGFGGVLMRSPGAWDRVYHKRLYRFIQNWSQRGRVSVA